MTTMKPYTCNDYRQEMILAGLRKQLADPHLSKKEKKQLLELIRQIEIDMGLT